MPEIRKEGSEVTGSDRCIDISLQPLTSQLKASDGRTLVFTRAILAIRNACDQEVVSIHAHAALGQEGGTVQDVTDAFTRSVPASLSPGEMVTCDVYDTLLPAHPGTASKVHMFGYRAALNWLFDLSVWIEYRISGSSHARTPVSRWSLRWSLAEGDAGKVDLSIEAAEISSPQ